MRSSWTGVLVREEMGRRAQRRWRRRSERCIHKPGKAGACRDTGLDEARRKSSWSPPGEPSRAPPAFQAVASRTKRGNTCCVRLFLVCGTPFIMDASGNAHTWLLAALWRKPRCLSPRPARGPLPSCTPSPLATLAFTPRKCEPCVASGPLHLLFPARERSSPLVACLASCPAFRSPTGLPRPRRPKHSSPGLPCVLLPPRADLGVHLNHRFVLYLTCSNSRCRSKDVACLGDLGSQQLAGSVPSTQSAHSKILWD